MPVDNEVHRHVDEHLVILVPLHEILVHTHVTKRLVHVLVDDGGAYLRIVELVEERRGIQHIPSVRRRCRNAIGDVHRTDQARGCEPHPILVAHDGDVRFFDPLLVGQFGSHYFSPY